MIWSMVLGFIQSKNLLLTLVSYYPRDFGRMLLLDQSITFYSLLEDVELLERLATMGSRGRGGDSNFYCVSPALQLGQPEWTFYYVTVTRKMTELA